MSSTFSLRAVLAGARHVPIPAAVPSGVHTRMLAALAGLLGLCMASAAHAQCPISGPRQDVQFPGPPARYDLRESVSAQRDKECMQGVHPRRLSKQELRELRKAVRTQMMYSRRQAASHSR